MKYDQYKRTLDKIDTILNKIEELSICIDNDLGNETLDCLDKFLEIRDCFVCRYKESKHKRLSVIDFRQSIIEYAKQGLTIQEIADATNRSYSYIQQIVKNLNIDVKRQRPLFETSQRNKDIYELRKQGLTLKEIGLRYGIQRERVRQICNSIKRKELEQW